MTAALPGLAVLALRGRVLWLTLFCLGFCQTADAARQAPSTVQDLQYGEVLFHYYQQDYFTSIIRLLTARAQSRLPHHADEAELLLGGLDLSYGLRDEAEDIFTRLLDADSTREEVRNRAWYYLAKVSWQRGEPKRALQALEKIDGQVPAAISADAVNLHSLALLSTGRNDEAIAVLQQSRAGKDWSPYLRYNLGVALTRAGRGTAGEAQLDTVGTQRADDEEARLLRDKANLALGYGYLQNGSAEESRRVLERVRLEGPLSNKALLGTGWADAEAGDYARALVPWTELGKRAPTDPAVQESLLAVPYAMNRMNLHGRAVQHYDTAITVFQRERERLDESIGAIDNGELLAALRNRDKGAGRRVQLPGSVSETPALRYLPELLATNKFQEGIRNYRDLVTLEGNLDAWATSISAYDEMLAARKARYALHEPDAARALHSETLEALAQRESDLAETVRRIESGDDPVGLASADETRQWNRLTEIGASINRLPPSDETRALSEQQQRLRGVLYWQMNADYKARLWQAKRQLAELDTLLAKARQSREDLQQTGVGVTAGFGAFDERIAAHKIQIDRLQARTARTRLAQGGEIERLAISELENQKKRLDSYLIQARFALAQTYDSALNTRPAAETGTGQ
ncbi:MAG: tetratricopeptide repeat protein [Gammaproteobacteria bacterium]